MPRVEARLIDDAGEEVPGTASRPASCRCAARGSPAPTARTRRPRSSTTAGCAPATSRRSTPRLHPDLRPLEGRHQVRRRVDLLGRPRERADGPRRGRRGGGDRACPTSAGPSARSPASCSRRARTLTPAELREHLPSASRSGGCRTSFAFIDEVPKTSVGKFDKKVLRQQLAEDRLTGRRPVENGSSGPAARPKGRAGAPGNRLKKGA